MLKAIQKNIVLQTVLILAALVLLWIRPLLSPQPMPGGEHPAILYALLCQWLAAVPRLAVIIAMLLVLAEGVLLNILLSETGLVSQNSLLPTLLFVIVSSAGATTLTPVLLVNGVAIACLHQLMLRGTLLTISPGKICSATALTGIATMFCQPAILLLLTYLLVAVNYRLYSWRDWILLLFGFAAPFLPLLAVLSFTGGVETWWQETLAGLSDAGLRTGDSGTMPVIGSLLLTVVFLWSLLTTLGHMGERPVLWQKNVTTVLLFAVGDVGLLLYMPSLPIPMAVLSIPFTFCTTHLLTTGSSVPTGYGRRKSRIWIYDITFILTLTAAMIC